MYATVVSILLDFEVWVYKIITIEQGDAYCAIIKLVLVILGNIEKGYCLGLMCKKEKGGSANDESVIIGWNTPQIT